MRWLRRRALPEPRQNREAETPRVLFFKKTIAVISGKGGVGKSMVTSLLGASLARAGHKVAILDADVTGPSIPQAFGLKGYQAVGDESGIFPGKTSKAASRSCPRIFSSIPPPLRSFGAGR
jgi:Mrp family chromosome partitioning ATPase